MNDNQKKGMWAAIAIATLMILFPPFLEHYGAVKSLPGSTRYIGYHFIGDPPFCGAYCSVEIDLTRLLLQLLVVGTIAAGLMYGMKEKRVDADT